MGAVDRQRRPGDLGAPREDAVSRVDLATGRTVVTITVRRAPMDVAATPGAVWVTNSGGGRRQRGADRPGD
jgi:DNA-binding beta-propeller fold protein YncE